MRPKPAAKTHLPARSSRILLILGSIALCWIGVWMHLRQVHEQVEIAANQEARTLARNVEENVGRTV
jgi:hypothetical protein